MIRDTSIEIGDQQRRWQSELSSRHLRRNTIRYIDHLLNQFEELNLAEAGEIPPKLRREARDFLGNHEHPVGSRRVGDLNIGEVMEALFDVQDTLLVGSEDDEEI